jgi:hypothetical protein
MPIEIRELVIKAAVANSSAGDSSAKSTKEENAQDIIQQTLDQIHQVQRNENER